MYNSDILKVFNYIYFNIIQWLLEIQAISKLLIGVNEEIFSHSSGTQFLSERGGERDGRSNTAKERGRVMETDREYIFSPINLTDTVTLNFFICDK